MTANATHETDTTPRARRASTIGATEASHSESNEGENSETGHVDENSATMTGPPLPALFAMSGGPGRNPLL